MIVDVAKHIAHPGAAYSDSETRESKQFLRFFENEISEEMRMWDVDNFITASRYYDYISAQNAIRDVLERGKRNSPLTFTGTIPNATLGRIATGRQLHGYCNCFYGDGCESAAIMDAAMFLKAAESRNVLTRIALAFFDLEKTAEKDAGALSLYFLVLGSVRTSNDCSGAIIRNVALMQGNGAQVDLGANTGSGIFQAIVNGLTSVHLDGAPRLISDKSITFELAKT